MSVYRARNAQISIYKTNFGIVHTLLSKLPIYTETMTFELLISGRETIRTLLEILQKLIPNYITDAIACASGPVVFWKFCFVWPQSKVKMKSNSKIYHQFSFWNTSYKKTEKQVSKRKYPRLLALSNLWKNEQNWRINRAGH